MHLQVPDHLQDPENLPELTASAAGFLETYGTGELMGEAWGRVFRTVPPGQRFQALLAACGCPSDPGRFFSGLARQIRNRSGLKGSIAFEGRELPRLLVYHLLEAALPGQALCSVKTPEALAARTGAEAADRTAMKAVLDTYPVRLSAHVIRQSLVSESVAVQYLPFEDELDPTGHELTFDGHFKQGLMEQMYQNRAIFLLDMRCPVYCRFCFRKHKSLRKEASPTGAQVREAVARVAGNPRIREILITGGEPLLNPRNLEAAVDGLLSVPHVETIRLATRSLAYYPHLFLHHGGRVLSFLRSVSRRARALGKRLEIGVHMVHPDEISIQTLEIISDLTADGIPVYVQTPFLKGVNHRGPELGELFVRLRQAGAQIYYIFTPCHPIHGTRKYWSPISLSFDAYAWMRRNISDRCMPKLCTATPLGKMEWHTSGWAVAPDGSAPDHIWIRTPYTREYFTPMVQEGPLPVETRENSGGTLDVRCLIDVGDPRLFLGDGGPDGGREKGPSDQGEGAGLKRSPGQDAARTDEILSRFLDGTPLMTFPEETGNDGIFRLHKTRVLVTLTPDRELAGEVARTLEETPEVTDVVLRLPDAFFPDLEGEILAVEGLARALAALGRYLCLRLQWARVQSAPGAFGPKTLSRLRALARFGAASPFRLEFETWWLTGDQITGAHTTLVSRMTEAGMAVYANTALIAGINTDPALALALAHAVRRGGMEFHHVYTGGLEIQKELNGPDPLPAAQVTALASRIRMHCTGREVPLYVHWTGEGERDFGLPA